MSSIAEAQQEIAEEFSLFGDWQEKYAHIIEMGRELPPMDPANKTEEQKVKGCQSQVWLHAEKNAEGKVQLQAESDALIVQGLIALLLKIYHNRTPAEILETELTFLDQIGLTSHLSMNRTNGLHSMVKQIRAYAVAFSA